MASHHTAVAIHGDEPPGLTIVIAYWERSAWTPRPEGARTMRTIIQVLPAMTGAKAVYLGAEPPESYTLALVAWALVEDEDGNRHVEGMVARRDQVIFADEGRMVELVTYVASGDDEVTEEEIAEAWRNRRGRGS